MINSEIKTLSNIILGLRKHKSKDNLLNVNNFLSYKNHLLGIDPKDNNIVVLIDTKNSLNTNKMSNHSKLLCIDYNQICDIKLSKRQIRKDIPFTILKLKSDDEIIINRFYEICIILLNKLGQNPTIEETYNEIQYLQSMFSSFKLKSTKEILGLWGELFFIWYSNKSSEIIKAWHKDKYDKLDFNNGHDKFEIKTTIQNQRIHNFELNQLKKFRNCNTYIVSIMTTQTDTGLSINDLKNRILSKINKNERIQFLDKFYNTIGDDIDKTENFKYDDTMARSETRIYLSDDVPKPGQIPSAVKNVKFEVNLNEIKNVSINKIKLFNKNNGRHL